MCVTDLIAVPGENPPPREVTVIVRVFSYKAVILAVEFACAGEEDGPSRHVDAHGERLCGKQRLE